MIDPNSPVATLEGDGSRSDTTITIHFVEADEESEFGKFLFNNFGIVEKTSEGWTIDEQNQFMAAMLTISNYVDLTFVASNDVNADFQVVKDTNEFGSQGELAYFYTPVFDGDNGAVMGAFNANGFGWDAAGLLAGGLGYSTIIHEVLHGLGLDHPHDGDGILRGLEGFTSRFDFPFGYYGDFELNQGVYTIMSYNDGWNEAPGGDNFGNAASPMALDIAVLQELYGANETHNITDTVYIIPDDNASWISIWDTGGNDSIQYNGTKDVTIDLREATLIYGEGAGGFISSADGVAGGFTIANGAVIENATGGSGDDTLIGNAADNALTGNGGADVARGGTGDDEIDGGSGNDTLYGDSGEDFIFVSSGANTLYGGSGADELDGGSDVDTFYGGSGDDVLEGGDGGDFLFGGRGNDEIYGDEGSDTIVGGLDADSLSGGDGADTFVFNSVADSFTQNEDTIQDFETGLDLIDLSAIDANLGLAGDQAFVIVNSFSNTAGEIVLDFNGNDTTVLVDRDGDGFGEMEIEVGDTSLDAGDFIL